METSTPKPFEAQHEPTGPDPRFQLTFKEFEYSAKNDKLEECADPTTVKSKLMATMSKLMNEHPHLKDQKVNAYISTVAYRLYQWTGLKFSENELKRILAKQREYLRVRLKNAILKRKLTEEETDALFRENSSYENCAWMRAKFEREEQEWRKHVADGTEYVPKKRGKAHDEEEEDAAEDEELTPAQREANAQERKKERRRERTLEKAFEQMKAQAEEGARLRKAEMVEREAEERKAEQKRRDTRAAFERRLAELNRKVAMEKEAKRAKARAEREAQARKETEAHKAAAVLNEAGKDAEAKGQAHVKPQTEAETQAKLQAQRLEKILQDAQRKKSEAEAKAKEEAQAKIQAQKLEELLKEAQRKKSEAAPSRPYNHDFVSYPPGYPFAPLNPYLSPQRTASQAGPFDGGQSEPNNSTFSPQSTSQTRPFMGSPQMPNVPFDLQSLFALFGQQYPMPSVPAFVPNTPPSSRTTPPEPNIDYQPVGPFSLGPMPSFMLNTTPATRTTPPDPKIAKIDYQPVGVSRLGPIQSIRTTPPAPKLDYQPVGAPSLGPMSQFMLNTPIPTTRTTPPEPNIAKSYHQLAAPIQPMRTTPPEPKITKIDYQPVGSSSLRPMPSFVPYPPPIARTTPPEALAPSTLAPITPIVLNTPIPATRTTPPEPKIAKMYHQLAVAEPVRLGPITPMRSTPPEAKIAKIDHQPLGSIQPTKSTPPPPKINHQAVGPSNVDPLDEPGTVEYLSGALDDKIVKIECKKKRKTTEMVIYEETHRLKKIYPERFQWDDVNFLRLISFAVFKRTGFKFESDQVLKVLRANVNRIRRKTYSAILEKKMSEAETDALFKDDATYKYCAWMRDRPMEHEWRRKVAAKKRKSLSGEIGKEQQQEVIVIEDEAPANPVQEVETEPSAQDVQAQREAQAKAQKEAQDERQKAALVERMRAEEKEKAQDRARVQAKEALSQTMIEIEELTQQNDEGGKSQAKANAQAQREAEAKAQAQREIQAMARKEAEAPARPHVQSNAEQEYAERARYAQAYADRMRAAAEDEARKRAQAEARNAKSSCKCDCHNFREPFQRREAWELDNIKFYAELFSAMKPIGEPDFLEDELSYLIVSIRNLGQTKPETIPILRTALLMLTAPLSHPNGERPTNISGPTMYWIPVTYAYQEAPSSSGQQVHRCFICGNTYMHKRGLHQHLSVHSGAMPYKCNLCTATFRYKSNLYEHLSVHSGETPYTCQFCGKKCRLKSNLKKHLLIHVTTKAELEAAWRPFVSRNPPVPQELEATPAQNADAGKVDEIQNGAITQRMDVAEKIRRSEEGLLNENYTFGEFFDAIKAISFETSECPTCNALFMTQTDVCKHHIQQHKTQLNEFRFFCRKCIRQFDDQEHLEQHMNYHAMIAEKMEKGGIQVDDPKILVPSTQNLLNES
ncbi:unnamed protein product [Caenorhabditis sp. 36 PRJEB53466]|nr:unnamed protein product [Caenorhabditis sp. 36 PRJEB53466]